MGDKEVLPNPISVAWVTNDVSTSPVLYIEFKPSPREPQRKRNPRSAIGLFKLLAS